MQKSLIAAGVALAALTFVALDSTYVVDSGQVAYVRMNGSAAKADIVHPGRHFSVPFVSKIDRINVTQNNVHIDPFQVKTVDNQSIGLKINVTYDVPEASAYHILYEIGVPGDADIADNIQPIVKDRARQVLATRNTTSLSRESGEVQAEITRVVHDELNRLFQVHVASLQIEQFIYSEAFEASNNNAVLAKNKAILEENNKNVVQYQADQKVLTAKGEADQAIQAARGKAESAKLESDGIAYRELTVAKAKAQALTITAQADKDAATLRGAGDASALKAIVEASGGASAYVAKLNAEAAQRWNGTVPNYIVSDKSASTFFPLRDFSGSSISVK